MFYIYYQVFQRGIFFALLNPQPNGAGFAGVKHSLEGTDLTGNSFGYLNDMNKKKRLNGKVIYCLFFDHFC